MQISAEQHAQACEFLARLSRESSRRDAETAVLLKQTAEAFRWGRIDRRTAAFQPQPQSGDSATLGSDDLMHRRTRSEDLNNAQVKRIVEVLADLIIGSGMQTFADPFSADMSLSDLGSGFEDELAYMLEADDLHEQWSLDARQCDAEGKQTLPEMQRQAIAECARVGDAFILQVQKPRTGRLVPLCYQILERDQLCRHLDTVARPGQNKIVGGVEVDRGGVIVAYHFYDEHPYDDYGVGQSYGASTRIPAERILHLGLFRRPSDHLGYSWLHAVGQTLFDRDKFVGAEIQTAAKAALLLLVAKLKNVTGSGGLGLLDDTDTVDQYGNAPIKLGSTPVAMKVSADDDVQLVESNRPNSTADSFLKILDHDTAGGAGLSYYSLTGRYEATNFSSVRAAKLDEDGHIKPLQGWFASRVALPMRQAFHAQAAALDLLSNLSFEDYQQQPRKFNRFQAIGAGRDLLDPEAEINASLAKLRSGQSTLQIECARRNLHWIRVLIQAARENAMARRLGVVLDFTKGQGGQVTGSSRDSQQPAKFQSSPGGR